MTTWSRKKGACLATRTPKKKTKRSPRIRLGAPDGRITPRAGLHLVKKLDELLRISAAIDTAGSELKSRKRGLGLGALLVALAETMLAGGDFLCDLDFWRKDAPGRRLRSAPGAPASTTVIGLGKRFDAEMRGRVERANAAVIKTAFAMLARKRREKLASARPPIDLDPTDVEVHGKKKHGTAYNYAGVTGRDIWRRSSNAG